MLLWLVGAVTIVTGEVFLLVHAAHPEQLIAIFVAGLAAGVACFHCGGPLRSETDIRGGLFTPAIVRLTNRSCSCFIRNRFLVASEVFHLERILGRLSLGQLPMPLHVAVPFCFFLFVSPDEANFV